MAEPDLPPHRTLVEVRFREVDSYGVAWHGHFIDWLEVARHRFAAHFGFDSADDFIDYIIYGLRLRQPRRQSRTRGARASICGRCPRRRRCDHCGDDQQ